VTSGPVSREEFSALAHRIDLLDERGTSQAGGVLARLAAVERKLADQTAGRRWATGILITAAAAASAIASFLAIFIFHAR